MIIVVVEIDEYSGPVIVPSEWYVTIEWTIKCFTRRAHPVRFEAIWFHSVNKAVSPWNPFHIAQFLELDLLVPQQLILPTPFRETTKPGQLLSLYNFYQKVQIKCQQPRRNAHKLPTISWLITLPFNIGTTVQAWVTLWLFWSTIHVIARTLFDNKSRHYYFSSFKKQ